MGPRSVVRGAPDRCAEIATRTTKSWRSRLDQRISELERLRDDLDGCIGCGCLSLQRCNLYNKADRLAERGPGARILNVGIPGEL